VQAAISQTLLKQNPRVLQGKFWIKQLDLYGGLQMVVQKQNQKNTDALISYKNNDITES